jgi:hypothetical protein
MTIPVLHSFSYEVQVREKVGKEMETKNVYFR